MSRSEQHQRTELRELAVAAGLPEPGLYLFAPDGA